MTDTICVIATVRSPVNGAQRLQGCSQAEFKHPADGHSRAAAPEKNARAATAQIALLHYDCIGIDDWKRKWSRRIDASGTATAMRAARNKQLELFKQA